MEVSPDSALRSHFQPLKAGFLTLVKPATENRGVVGSIPTLAIDNLGSAPTRLEQHLCR